MKDNYVQMHGYTYYNERIRHQSVNGEKFAIDLVGASDWRM